MLNIPDTEENENKGSMGFGNTEVTGDLDKSTFAGVLTAEFSLEFILMFLLSSLSHCPPPSLN